MTSHSRISGQLSCNNMANPPSFPVCPPKPALKKPLVPKKALTMLFIFFPQLYLFSPWSLTDPLFVRGTLMSYSPLCLCWGKEKGFIFFIFPPPPLNIVFRVAAHPSDASRIHQIKKAIPDAMKCYYKYRRASNSEAEVSDATPQEPLLVFLSPHSRSRTWHGNPLAIFDCRLFPLSHVTCQCLNETPLVYVSIALNSLL